MLALTAVTLAAVRVVTPVNLAVQPRCSERLSLTLTPTLTLARTLTVILSLAPTLTEGPGTFLL